jgi:hypothetical protein
MTESEDWRPSLQIEGVTKELREAIGAVVIALTNAEHTLVELFQFLTDLEPDVAHCIVKDMKSIQIQKMVREIAELKQEKIKHYNKFCETLSDLSRLRDERNQYTHWLWAATGTSLQISKIGLAEATSKRRQRELDINTVRKTADELARVGLWLWLFLLPLEEWTRIGDELISAAETAERLSGSPGAVDSDN